VKNPKLNSGSFVQNILLPLLLNVLYFKGYYLLINTSFQIKDLACGYGFTVYAVESNQYKLFGCGLNTDSQIGKIKPIFTNYFLYA